MSPMDGCRPGFLLPFAEVRTSFRRRCSSASEASKKPLKAGDEICYRCSY